MIPEAAQDVEVGHDLGRWLRPGARHPAGQGRVRGQLAPDDLAGGADLTDLDENPVEPKAFKRRAFPVS
jgi:hypothetical protein